MCWQQNNNKKTEREREGRATLFPPWLYSAACSRPLSETVGPKHFQTSQVLVDVFEKKKKKTHFGCLPSFFWGEGSVFTLRGENCDIKTFMHNSRSSGDIKMSFSIMLHTESVHRNIFHILCFSHILKWIHIAVNDQYLYAFIFLHM